MITVILVTVLWGCKFNNNLTKVSDTPDNVKTNFFIQELDIAKYERTGSDFGNSKYNPERIGKLLPFIDEIYDYDFDALEDVERKLEGVDRQKALKAIFRKVTKDTETNLEKHLAILRFLQKSSFHNRFLQPTYRDKQAVYDPLVLLELNEMRCGHVARVAVDLFAAAGYEARLVQAGGHVLAEIRYDNDWHYFDADLFGGGETVIKDGEIPSIDKLSSNPYLLDRLSSGSHYENFVHLTHQESQILFNVPNYYPSTYYFHKSSYSNYPPLHYQKTALPKDLQNKWYGWNYYLTSIDKQRKLINNQPVHHLPSSISYKDIFFVELVSDTTKTILNLEWSKSTDLDSDLLGYKIYVARKSRGWNTPIWYGDKYLEIFNHDMGLWNPEMYNYLFQEPPHDVFLLSTPDTKIDFALDKGHEYYITVMPTPVKVTFYY
jgi:hypothetical protein